MDVKRERRTGWMIGNKMEKRSKRRAIKLRLQFHICSSIEMQKK